MNKWQLLSPRHAPEDSLPGHLEFALKWEGVDLAVLAALFQVVDDKQIKALVRSAPTPASVRTDTFPPANAPSTSASSLARGEVLDQVLPDVSEKALATIHGVVRVAVRVHVDPTGNVSDAALDSSGPSKYFADLALQARSRRPQRPQRMAHSLPFLAIRLQSHSNANRAVAFAGRNFYVGAGSACAPLSRHAGAAGKVGGWLVPWECGEQIETGKVKLENSEEKIPTHAAHEWGTLLSSSLI